MSAYHSPLLTHPPPAALPLPGAALRAPVRLEWDIRRLLSTGGVLARRASRPPGAWRAASP